MSDRQVPRQPISAGDVKKNNFIMLKNRPCKVAEVRTSKTGKHGHAKANITGVCVLTDQKCNEVHPASAGLVEFKMEKLDYLLTDAQVAEGTYTLTALNDDNDEVTFKSSNSELCKGKEAYELFVANPEKQFIICVIRAPVQIGEEYRDEELIESVKEDKAAK